MDWSDGDYERTAVDIEPAAAALVEFAGVAAGHHVLDVGAGTGNATLAAASAGARVTGIDPAEGLIEIARDRVAMLDADITFLEGTAERLPVSDDVADVTLSAFGIIFSADPPAAIGEMCRTTRPAGTVAFTTWRPTGAVNDAAEVLLDHVPARDDPPRWGDDTWLESLLADAGLERIAIVDRRLRIRSDSPAGFFALLESDHPVWRAIRRSVSESEWDEIRAKSVAALEAGNEDQSAFLATSVYALVRGTVPV